MRHTLKKYEVNSLPFVISSVTVPFAGTCLLVVKHHFRAAWISFLVQNGNPGTDDRIQSSKGQPLHATRTYGTLVRWLYACLLCTCVYLTYPNHFYVPPPFSFDTAVSSLKLLQTSPVTVRGSWAVSDWAKYLYKALTESSRLILECLVTATVTLQPELNFNSLSNHNKTAEMICCIHDLS